MKRSIVWTGVLLAILGLGWWLARDSGTQGIDLVVAGNASAPADRIASTEIPVPEESRLVAGASPLAADSGFCVQVVGLTGKPIAGVPIVIRSSLADSVAFDIYATTTKGTDGIARIPHIEQPLPGEKPSTTVIARVAITTFDIVSGNIDLENLPKEPVQLTLPDCGSVVVLLHDSEGTRILPKAVDLADKRMVDDLGAIGGDPLNIHDCRLEAGRAEFPFVRIGLDLFVRAFGNDKLAHAEGTGPRVFGEQVTIDLDFGPPLPVLTGRIVDEQGQASANFAVSAQVEMLVKGGGGARGGTVTTDDEGRFRLRLPVAVGANLTGALTLRPARADYQSTMNARVELDSRIHAGENDLGDIVMCSPRFLVAGRVIDDLGAPVPNALVDGDVMRTVDGKEVWRNDSQYAGKTAADGTFSIDGGPPTSRFRLRASRPGYVAGENSNFAPGASNVWITLTRSSRIAGQILLGKAEAGREIWASAARSDDTAEKRSLFHDRERVLVQADGSFELKDVRPGRCRLILSRGNENAPILVIDDLELLPGEASTDPRVAPIDLRGKFDAAAAKTRQD